jgi:hypothetical protein
MKLQLNYSWATNPISILLTMMKIRVLASSYPPIPFSLSYPLSLMKLTVLHIAASKGISKEVMGMLITTSRIDVDKENNMGVSPMHIAGISISFFSLSFFSPLV